MDEMKKPSSIYLRYIHKRAGFMWKDMKRHKVSYLLILPYILDSLAASVYNEYSNFGGSMNFISPGYVSMMNNTGTILAILPLLILYLVCQKYFVEGIERSGIVG